MEFMLVYAGFFSRVSYSIFLFLTLPSFMYTLCVDHSDVRNLERKKRFLLTLLLILLFLKSMLSI